MKNRKQRICGGTVLWLAKNGSPALLPRKLYELSKNTLSAGISASKENHASRRDFSFLAAGDLFFSQSYFCVPSPQKRRAFVHRRKTTRLPIVHSRPSVFGRKRGGGIPVFTKNASPHTYKRMSFYFAYSVLRVSRITFTRIWPGYSISVSIRLAISLASTLVPSSVTSSGLTIMRTSRPD